jgi:SAM-dependent methyltransferase
MEPRLETNLANWNNRVRTHAQSQFYDVEGWLRDAPGPQFREIEALGDVVDTTLVHLQCHFGMDTLRWARAGATVTGLDFSTAAIAEATSLAQRAGLSERASFVCANDYDAPQALLDNRIDIVYVSLGSLCWLPDVAAWGGVVADLLAPGGRRYLHDVHPFTSCLDNDGERVVYSYFEDPNNPFIDDGIFTYTDGETLTSNRTYEWNHELPDLASRARRNENAPCTGCEIQRARVGATFYPSGFSPGGSDHCASHPTPRHFQCSRLSAVRSNSLASAA